MLAPVSDTIMAKIAPDLVVRIQPPKLSNAFMFILQKGAPSLARWLLAAITFDYKLSGKLSAIFARFYVSPFFRLEILWAKKIDSPFV
jgi:hypothetical protein